MSKAPEAKAAVPQATQQPSSSAPTEAQPVVQSAAPVPQATPQPASSAPTEAQPVVVQSAAAPQATPQPPSSAPTEGPKPVNTATQQGQPALGLLQHTEASKGTKEDSLSGLPQTPLPPVARMATAETQIVASPFPMQQPGSPRKQPSPSTKPGPEAARNLLTALDASVASASQDLPYGYMCICLI